MNTLRNRLLGLAASLALAALAIGLPALLLATTPGYLPSMRSWDDLVAFLASPDDGTLAWLAIWAAGWIVWVILAGLILTEVIGAIRAVRPPQLRAVAWPQQLVRNLVATAALLFIATPTLATLPAPVAAAQPIPASPTPDPADLPAKTVAASSATVDYVVQPGDSLWRIAEHHLGDGNRYPEIVDLNTKLLRRGPDFIREGWTLKLPAIQTANGYDTYTVRKGDTLSEIALEELGDAHAWPEIADASRSIIQPDGRRLTDPDKIDIGWTLHIPTRAVAEPTVAHPEPSEEPKSAPPPNPAASPTPTLTAPSATPTPTPSPVTPTPTGFSSTATPSATPEVTLDDAEYAEIQPPWMLIGITGGGALLAGALWWVLKRRRAHQFRHRRPGRRPATPDEELIPVERSIHLAASTGAEDLVQHIDAALKDLASHLAFNERPMPHLAAVQLTAQGITLHLAEPMDQFPHPWVGASVEWQLDTGHLAQLERSEQVAPYPLLVTVGSDDAGGIWLINPEQYGTITISGDPTFAEDLVRSMTAEIGVQPWAEDARAECVGIAAEIQPLNPARIHHHTQPMHIGALVSGVIEHTGRLDETAAVDTPTARAADAGYDVWHGHLILIANQHGLLAKPLRDLVTAQPGRTGTAVVLMTAEATDDSELHLNLTSDGRLEIPERGLNLLPVGITSDEASGFARLLIQASTVADAPIRVHNAAEVGWESLADQTGAVREELTVPRDGLHSLDNTATSVLPEPDEAYLDAAATTADDLARLAPGVPATIARAAAEADPTLDADLSDWYDQASPRPKVRVLGPVSVELKDGGEPAIVGTSRGSYVELLAFLATRTRGATTQQVADALRIDPSRVRGTVSKLRDWLGINPETGEHFVPLMHHSDATRASGVRAYELKGVLVDADLFRRLHLRGTTRGPDGIDDLKAALTLVTGEPLTGFNDNRGNWVYDGERVDQQYVVAIADVAHIVATAALHDGDGISARKAALAGMKACPADDVARLDYERAGGRLDQLAGVPGSPFAEDEDWPDRSREVAARSMPRARTPRPGVAAGGQRSRG